MSIRHLVLAHTASKSCPSPWEVTKFCLPNKLFGPKFPIFLLNFFKKISKKLNFLYFSLLAKVLITIKIKILTLFKKSPKMEPNFWALFLKKNCAKGFKKSPKWRKIAQSGHTDQGKAREVSIFLNFSIKLGMIEFFCLKNWVLGPPSQKYPSLTRPNPTRYLFEWGSLSYR